MDGLNILDQFGPSEFLSDSQISDLSSLLAEYASVSKPPTRLPPVRANDHHINLQPNTKPISVRPYRYTHTQKDEIEKLVGDMLADNIIQPSSNLYSSPALLVKKKKR